MLLFQTVSFFYLPGLAILALSFALSGAIPPDTRSAKNPLHISSLLRKNHTNQATDSTMIPFSKAGNLIIVKAVVDSLEGNFILDTGAPYLILNVVYFRDYPVTVVSDQELTGMGGIATLVNKTNVKSFSFGDLKYQFTDADLVDLGHIENSKGIKILGLIGFELLKQCEMIIDYEKNVIHLSRIERRERKTYKSRHLENDPSFSTIPIEIKDNKIIAETQMKICRSKGSLIVVEQ